MKSNHFTIIIPAYNCENWVDKNLLSALEQDYDNYDLVYIDDASTDKTFEKAKDILSKSQKKFKLVSNKKNVRALKNLYDHITTAKDDSIIVTLDGDDFLATPDTLSYLNKIYQDEDCWMTVGSYMQNDNYQVVSPVSVTQEYWNSNIRKQPWSFSHLRTFKKNLFNKINIEDMLDDDGEFYKFTFDRVMMYPMVEMAGPKHITLINKVLYIYNRLNPISVDRVHRRQQLRIESIVVNKAPYKRIEVL